MVACRGLQLRSTLALSQLNPFTPRVQVFRVKGSGTPVQCASTDVTVDPVTGHLVLRGTTPSTSTLNYEVGASDATVNISTPGRKLLASSGDSQAASRSLLQINSTPTQTVSTLSAVCAWHSADFYNTATGSYLTGPCSQFPYAKTVNIPMLPAGGQRMGHYHPATWSQGVNSVAWASFAEPVTSTFCQWDLYRVYVNKTSWLDFCFQPFPSCMSRTQDHCCSSNNCPSGPFINYQNLQYDPNLFSLPCITNKYGRVTYVSGGVSTSNDACIRPIGFFPMGQGDPMYRLSAQMGNAQWFPEGTTTTETAGGMNGRRLHAKGSPPPPNGGFFWLS